MHDPWPAVAESLVAAIYVDNAELELRPGMVVTVTFPLDGGTAINPP